MNLGSLYNVVTVFNKLIKPVSLKFFFIELFNFLKFGAELEKMLCSYFI